MNRSLLVLCLVLISIVLTQEIFVRDSQAECTPYIYPPVSNQLSSFPMIWQPSKILKDDTSARAKWNSISASVPTNISLKGTPDGDYSDYAQTYDSHDYDCWWTVYQCVTPKLEGLPPDIADVPEPQTLGYGFDDGPNCAHNIFYDYLKSQNQKATMFFIGSNVVTWPLEAQRAIIDGHEICTHTWSHPYMTALSNEDAFSEFYYSIQAIKLATGATPTCWRPPYGDIDDRIRAIAHALGLRTILWKYDSNDWTEDSDTVDANYNDLISDAQKGQFNNTGVIMLTHELDNFTMSKAINFYPDLKTSFKYIVPIGVAMNVTQPYLERNYSLATFGQYNNLSTTTSLPLPKPVTTLSLNATVILSDISSSSLIQLLSTSTNGSSPAITKPIPAFQSVSAATSHITLSTVFSSPDFIMLALGMVVLSIVPIS